MASYEKEVLKQLKAKGCTFVRHGKGDHDIWFSPITNKHVTVDGTNKSRYTAEPNYERCRN